MKVVGLDLSLTSTGAASVDTRTGRVVVVRIQPKTMRGHERLDYILGQLAPFCEGAELAVIEGPSYNSKSSNMHQMSGNWWLVAQQLWRRRVPYAICPPWTLKSYVTGSGNASKERMVDEMRESYPSVVIAGDDMADALGLATLGCRYKLQQVDSHRARDLSQLAKVQWPDHTGQPGGLAKAAKPRFS